MAKKDTLIYFKIVTQGENKVPFECFKIGGILVWLLDGVEVYKCSIFRLLRLKSRLVVNDIIRTSLFISGVDTLEVKKIIKGEITCVE